MPIKTLATILLLLSFHASAGGHKLRKPASAEASITKPLESIFYSTAMGLPVRMLWENNGEAEVVVYGLGQQIRDPNEMYPDLPPEKPEFELEKEVKSGHPGGSEAIYRLWKQNPRDYRHFGQRMQIKQSTLIPRIPFFSMIKNGQERVIKRGSRVLSLKNKNYPREVIIDEIFQDLKDHSKTVILANDGGLTVPYIELKPFEIDFP